MKFAILIYNLIKSGSFVCRAACSELGQDDDCDTWHSGGNVSNVSRWEKVSRTRSPWTHHVTRTTTWVTPGQSNLVRSALSRYKCLLSHLEDFN